MSSSAHDLRVALALVVVAALGVGVRFLGDREAPPGAVAYRPAPGERPSRDSVAERSARLARPLAKNETIDVDRATAEDLMRLPKVGPALALRIVEDRERNGPFGNLAALDRVAGIGPATLQELLRHTVFSGTPGTRAQPHRPLDLNRASVAELATLPGIGPAKAAAIVSERERRGRFHRIEDLLAVPGIGAKTLAGLRDLVGVS